jgi:Flp pilus assembly protein TadG
MKRRKESGATIVEFALILPILLMVLFAISQFAWLISNYLMLVNAASVGARVLASERGYASPYTDTKNAILVATQPLKNTLTIATSVGGAACTSDTTCQTELGTMNSAPSAGSIATVSLTYSVSPIFGGSLGNLKSVMPTTIKSSMSEVIQ